MPSKPKLEKKRLDVLVVERGLADSREKAQAMILAGEVRVNGSRSDKAGMQVATDARIEISGTSAKYASRGGLKLEGALKDFGVDVSGKTCLDIGASTGGFTDCLLAHGARQVYAIDVTPEQMDWRLQQDARVKRIKENARNLRPEQIPEPADLVTVDVSFISVSKVLPAVVEALHARAIERVRRAAEGAGLRVEGVRPSRLAGAEGNQEFFLHARSRPGEDPSSAV